jgi:hypothetical protein
MRWERLQLWIGAVAAAGLAGARLVGAPPSLLAWPGGEVYGHAWVQWWWGQGLDPGTLVSGGDGWRVIDPLTTALAAGLGRAVGEVAAWNAVSLGGVALAFAGGAALARRIGGSPLVGGAALALAPIYLGSLASGLTEDAALGLVALALSLLLGPRLRERLLGGALLGLSAWCGLYLALAGAWLALVVGAASLIEEARSAAGRASEGRALAGRALAGWVGAAALAAGGAAAALAAQGERIAGEGHRFGQGAPRFEPLWAINPWRGADLASFFAPGHAPLTADALVRLHPAYLGWVALLLALLAVRQGRWWIGLLGAAVLCTGPSLSWAGRPLGLENPLAALVAGLPGLELLNHYGRLLLAGAVALSALAALGAARLEGWSPARWRPLVAPALAALIAAEIGAASPAPLPLPLTPAGIDPVWAALADGEGAVLPVPLAGPGVNFQRPLYEQRAHGRRLLLHANRPGQTRAARSPEGRWLAALGSRPMPAPAAPDRARLAAAGLRAVVAREPYVATVTEVLGPPDRAEEGGAIWNIEP